MAARKIVFLRPHLSAAGKVKRAPKKHPALLLGYHLLFLHWNSLLTGKY